MKKYTYQNHTRTIHVAKIHGHSYKPGALTNKKSLAKSKNSFYCKCKIFTQQHHFFIFTGISIVHIPILSSS